MLYYSYRKRKTAQTMKGNTEATYETVKKMRGDWGNVKPYTRVELSKKKQKKEKHKKDWRRDYETMD